MVGIVAPPELDVTSGLRLGDLQSAERDLPQVLNPVCKLGQGVDLLRGRLRPDPGAPLLQRRHGLWNEVNRFLRLFRLNR